MEPLNRIGPRRGALVALIGLLSAMGVFAQTSSDFRIALRDGEVITAELRSRSLQISTGYAGTITVPVASITSVDFGRVPGDMVTLESIYGDRLTGHVLETAIELTLAAGRYSIPVADFALMERSTPTRRSAAADEERVLLSLHNGDRIIGFMPELQLTTRFGRLALSETEQLSISLDPWLQSVARLPDGQTRTVTITDTSLRFRTSIGQALTVPIPAIARIGRSAGAAISLEDFVAAFDARYARITDIIPERFDFEGGVSGTNIPDGGNDMYDGGNTLTVGFQELPYTADRIVESDVLGEGGRYVTMVRPGIFVFAADIADLDQFAITGNLGADGSGEVEGFQLSARAAGEEIVAFGKRVFDAFDPSVNHLFVIPGGTDVRQDIPNDTLEDIHELSNLGEVERIYFLMYAGQQGRRITDDEHQAILEAFLGIIGN